MERFEFSFECFLFCFVVRTIVILVVFFSHLRYSKERFDRGCWVTWLALCCSLSTVAWSCLGPVSPSSADDKAAKEAPAVCALLCFRSGFRGIARKQACLFAPC
mmetsp:Transcript_36571/g.96366  ORF Transcript_36571/g.96366 Transcript_36571/m.96366 type:complete len:104 (+) Transcript_36571:10-321(+)